MEMLKNIDVLSFDCYGTLIDWETGLMHALRPFVEAHGITADEEQLLGLYGKLEAAEEQGEYKNYTSVLQAVARKIGQTLGFSVSDTEANVLVHSLGNWPPFPDTVETLQILKKKYRLAIISNTDDDLFRRTQERLGVNFDWIITAEQVGSYKPSPRNFVHALERIGTIPERILHVAQSLYHDIPAARSMGIKTVWIDRRYKKAGSGATLPADAAPDLAVPSLRTLARLLQIV